jgi:hypothetical protein
VKLTATYKPQRASVNINAQTMGVALGSPVAREYVERTPYTGPTEVNPSAETQTLLTKNLRMEDDITIKPIPQNYGLITWDGTKITVS